MATKRWYLWNDTILGGGWQTLGDAPTGANTLPTGWVVGTGSTNHSEFASGTGGDRASSTFTGTTVPDGTLDTTLKDAFRVMDSITGTFASGNWTFQFAVVSTVQSGAADGQIVFRLIKANADGSSATEITSAQQSASVCTNVAGTDINGTLTFNPGAITFTNQYLFVQVAWKRTGAGGMTTTNIRLRTGSSSTVGTTILSSDFTPGNQAVTTVHIASTAVIVGRGPTVRPDQAVTGATLRSNSLVGETVLFELTATGVVATWYLAGRCNSQTISGHAGTLTAVSLLMASVNSPTDAVYLEIRESSWDGTLLATSVQIAATGVSTAYDWVKFSLLTPVTLSAGTTYFIETYTTRVADDAAHSFNWRGNSSNPYSGGTAITSGGSSISNTDWSFRLITSALPAVEVVIPSQAVWQSFIPSSAHPFSTPETLLFELAGVSAYYQCSIDGPALAQSISGHDGAISSISLTLRKGGSPTDHVYLEVRQTTATGTLLATSAPIVASTLTTVPVWRNFPLTNTVLLVGGSTYFIRLVLTRTQVDGPNFVGWFISTSAYAAGVATLANGGTLNGGVDDLTFRLYTGESHRVTNGDIIAGETIASGSQVHVPTVAEGDKVVNVAFIGTSLAPVAVAAFNFRGSAAYVTDGVGQTYVLGSTAYPTNRDSLTFGWLTSALHANRSTSVDVRLAGLNYATGSVDEDFKFDLPSAGTYNIGLAMGDVTAAQSNQQIEIYDNTTLLLTLGRRNVSAGEFWDASDVKYTAAAWPTSQTPVPLVFATTTLILRLKGDGNSSAISHLSVAVVPTGGSAAELYPVDVAHGVAGPQTIDGATIASTSQLSIPAINTVAVPTILSGARVGTTQLFENPWAGGTLSATLAGRNFSQTISGHDGLLTSVALKLRKTGAPTDALYIDIRDAFNGTLLATSASLAFTDVPPGSTSAVNNWYLFPLDTPVPLVAATTYWIGVYRTAGSVSKFPYLLYDLLEPYPAGVLYDAAGAPQSGGTADLAFRLYVAAAPTVAAAQDVTLATIYSTARLVDAGTLLFEHATINTSHGLWETASEGTSCQSISGHAGVLTAVAVPLAWADSPSTDAVYLELRLGSVPGGTVLATSLAVSNATLAAFPTFGWVTFVFPGGVVLESGTSYVIQPVLTRTETNYDQTIRWGASNLNTYAGGGALYFDGSPISNYDSAFRLYTGGGHTVVLGGQAVTTFPIASGSLVQVPSVTVPAGPVLGATIGSSATVSAPSVSGGELPTTTTVVLRRVVPQFYRDIYRRWYTLRYRRIVVTVEAGPAPPSTQTIVGATIGGSVGDLLLEDSSGVLLEDGSALLLEGSVGLSQVFAPTVSQLAADQAVGGAFIGAGVFFSDSFPYGDGDLPTVSGSIYTTPTATAGNVVIVSHQAESASTGEHSTRLVTWAGGTPQWAEITYARHANFTGPSVWNYEEGGVPYFYVLEALTTGSFSFSRVRAGVFSHMQEFTPGVTLVPGDRLRLEVELVGAYPFLTARRNGVVIGTCTDNDALRLIAQGTPGFRLWNPGLTAQVSQFNAADSSAGVFAPTVALGTLNVLVYDLVSVAETRKAVVPVLRPRPVEAVSVVDSVTPLVKTVRLKATPAETIAVTDTVKSVLRQIAVHATEIVAVADAATPLVKTIRLKVAVAETVTATDFRKAVVPLAVRVADAVAVTDFRKAALPQLAVHAAETIAVTDFRKALVPALAVRVSDAVAVVDFRKAVLPQLAVHAAEALAVTDARTAVLGQGLIYAAVAETLTVTDVVTPLVKTIRLTVVVAETVAAVDSAKSVLRQIAAHPAEPVTVTDVATPLVTTVRLKAAVADILTVADAVTPLVKTVRLKAAVADTIAVTELRKVVATSLAAHPVETVTVTDAATPLRKTVRLTAQVADAITVTDFRKVVATPLASHPVETIAVTDSAAPLLRTARLKVAVAETVTALDAVTPLRKTVRLTASVADAVTVTEFVKRVLTRLAVHAADNVLVEDAPIVGAALISVRPTDLVTVADVAKVVLSPLTVRVAETVTVVDFRRAVLPQLAVHAADAIAVTELRKAVLPQVAVHAAETIAVTELRKAVLPQLAVHAAEIIAVADVAKRVLPQLVVRAAEVVAATDFRKVVATPLAVHAADSVSVAEFVKRVSTPLAVHAAETIAVTDFRKTVSTPLAVHAADHVTVTDVLAAGAASLSVSRVDGAAVTDVLKVVLRPQVLRAAETITVTDTVRVVATPLVVRKAETITVLDAVSTSGATLTLSRAVADSVGVTDAVRRGLGLGTRRAETVTVTETRKAVVGPLVARPVETVTVADAVTVVVTTVRLKGQPVETITVTDTARLVVKPLMVRVAETVTVLDSVRSGAASIQAAVAETIAVTDSVKAVLPQLTVRVAETVTALISVRAVLPALAVHVEDSLTVVEAVRAVLPQLGAHAADAVTVSDAPRTLTPTLAVHAAEVIAVEVDVLAVVALPRVRYAYVVETIAVTDSTPETSAQTIVHFVVGELRDTGSRSHLNGLVVSDDFEGVLMGGTGGTLESDDFAGVLVGVHGGSLRRVEEP